MSTISNYQQINSSWYTQNGSYTSALHRSKNNGSLREIGMQESGMSRSSKASETLDSLVANGTITEDQETAIKEAMQTAIQSSSYSRYKLQFNSTGSTTGEKGTDPLDSLVAAGTITEDQQAAIKEAFAAVRKSGHMPPPPPPPQESSSASGNILDSVLDSLVEAGTITDDQKTSIVDALQSAYETEESQTTTAVETGESDSLADYLNELSSSNYRSSSIASLFQYALKAYQTQSGSSFESLFSDSMQVIL